MTDTDWYQLIPTDTNWYQLIPTDTNWYQLYQLIPTNTNQYQPILTDTKFDSINPDLVLLGNIKQQAVTITEVYYYTELIRSIKGFIVPAHKVPN